MFSTSSRSPTRRAGWFTSSSTTTGWPRSDRSPRAYRDLVDRALNRTRARVEVPRPLTPAQRKELLTVLEEQVGGTVVAKFEERPELLAGFRVQVGSKVFDGSLVGQLEQLARATAHE